MINEPTLEHYHYYLRRVQGDSAQEEHKRSAAFIEEVRLLLAHLECLTGRAIALPEWPEEGGNRLISQCLLHTGWMENAQTGRSYFVEARTYVDVYWLQVGYYQSGKGGPEIFSRLRETAWRPAAELLLGSSQALAGISAGNMDTLATRMLAAYLGTSPDEMVFTRRADGRTWLCGTPDLPTVTVVSYPDAEGEAWTSRTLLNDSLPRLSLYWHKANRQLAWCEQNLSALFEQEKSMRSLLEHIQGGLQVDGRLVQRLVQLYQAYCTSLGMLAERKITIETSLSNLEFVHKELEPLAEDRLLESICARLGQRQKQLETDLRFADQTRQQAETVIDTLKVELAIKPLLETPENQVRRVGHFPGASSPLEAEIKALTRRRKPSQTEIVPRVEVFPAFPRLTLRDQKLLQKVYRGFGHVLIEKEFHIGFGGARVLLVLPEDRNGIKTSRKITKLGTVFDLRKERENYERYVENFLPDLAARVDKDQYGELGKRAGLNYGFVGQTMNLEEYYRQAAAAGALPKLLKTLDDLLDKGLGKSWYAKTLPLQRFFAGEYGQHLVEYVCLQLRPKSSDDVWLDDQAPPAVSGYRRIAMDAIPDEYARLQSGVGLRLDGLAIRKIMGNEVKLQDPQARGIVIRLVLPPGKGLPRGLQPDSRVGLRAEVIYNRQNRMIQILDQAFPGIASQMGNEAITLPGISGAYLNPLAVFPPLLGQTLEGRQSYVHGDLHPRNVLVDPEGKGWLIDFSKTSLRHNLFDFIKLETFLRWMILGSTARAFGLKEYIRLEQALCETSLGHNANPPQNPDLRFAYQVIKAMRAIARNYMTSESSIVNEYFPALFLYQLALMKYHQPDRLHPTRLAFTTACVLGAYLPPPPPEK